MYEGDISIPGGTQPRMRCFRLQAILLALHMAVAISSASLSAESGLAVVMHPSSIHLHVHREIADQRFVGRVVSRLDRMFKPAIEIHASAVDFQPLRERFGLLDADAIMDLLSRSIDWQSQPDVVHVFVVADDMRSPPANFNFAATYGTAETTHHMILISVARLQDRRWFRTEDSDPEATAIRVFKLVAKNTAKLAGYTASTRCLFAFPRSLSDLDAMPESFCEPDISALVAGGLLRTDLSEPVRHR